MYAPVEDDGCWNEDRRWRRHSYPGWRRGGYHGFILGVMIVAAGVLLLLQNLGVLYVGSIGQLWPLLLIGLGVGKLLQARRFPPAAVPGAILTILGVAFLARNLALIYGDQWRNLWGWMGPSLLIAAGAFLLVRQMATREVIRARDDPRA